MLQFQQYPTPTISKQIVIHTLDEMQSEHMARFMNEQRIKGFNEAKAMLLKMVDQYDDEISREKLDDDLDILMVAQQYGHILCPGNPAQQTDAIRVAVNHITENIQVIVLLQMDLCKDGIEPILTTMYV